MKPARMEIPEFDIKVCPLCEGKSALIPSVNDKIFIVRCNTCGCCTRAYPYMEHAVVQWNNRPRESS